MDLYQPAAIKRTDVRPPALIESHIPRSDALRPIRQNATERRDVGISGTKKRASTQLRKLARESICIRHALR
jgi:hypothetical protein